MGNEVRTISELIKDLQEVMAEHGDLPVWLRISWLGYDDTESRSAPLTDAPKVLTKRQIGGRFWFDDIDLQKKVVVLQKF